MILLVDIGNTRIKWAQFTLQGMGAQHAASYAGWDRAALDAQLLASLPKPERILISNVGGEPVAQLLNEGIQAKWSIVPEFIHTIASIAGVRCGYANPAKLGVDRWLGVIAAFHMRVGSACVVNVGTAMTIDGVDATGDHLGGVIVPGPDLAIASLLHNTSDIATNAQSGEVLTTVFADNTLGAVHQGVTHMLAATVERFVAEMRERLNVQPVLLLSGGANQRITPALRVSHRIIPDLVLQGLAVLART